MNVRPPVDLHLFGCDQIAPSAQAVARDAVCPSIRLQPHAAPIHRLNMHRPVRLNRLRADAGRQPNASLVVTLSSFLAQQFRLCLQGFCIGEHVQPTPERVLAKTMLAAIFADPEAASAPRLNVNRPPLTPGFVLEVFRTHRRISNAAENPIWNDNVLLGSVQGPDAYVDFARPIRKAR